MEVVVGLGNPGYEYEGTRHNVGFKVIDAIAEKLGIKLSLGIGEYLIGTKTIKGKKLRIVKPLTYMNNSGIAVREIIDHYAINPTELLIVTDDFHLPLGKLRFRAKGSSGGHNGLYSIICHLQTENFPRLRCGILGDSLPVNKKELSYYVLSPFDPGEIETVKKLIFDARDTVFTIKLKGLKSIRNQYTRIKA